ncbi:hypothetical protein MNBD_GAMMA02-1694 [hydrothermal vent metagenome]|uniref:Uncharacterized protein n=1 Tax=hydrothermal vent metagenome TaxID=652676 RepID=A0A3B0VU78_9ZZZZ
MSLALVFNHESLPYGNQENIDAAVLMFIKTSLSCRQYGFNLMLVDANVDKSWFGIELKKGVYWRDWFNAAKQKSELKDLVRAFRSLSTRQPMMLPQDAQRIENTVEVGLKGQSQGLATLQAAYWYETFLISFPVREPWCRSLIDVWILKMQEDGRSDESTSEINNLFDFNSIQHHECGLKNLRDERLQLGTDIWENRGLFFPCLYLLENELKNQLYAWSHKPAILHKAKDALLAMNKFVQRWQEGGFDDYRHSYLADCGLSAEVSGESPSVKQDLKKKAEREFWLPEGKKVFCENHVKLQDGFRLHFYASNNEKVIYVAYLGPHLTL